MAFTCRTCGRSTERRLGNLSFEEAIKCPTPSCTEAFALADRPAAVSDGRATAQFGPRSPENP